MRYVLFLFLSAAIAGNASAAGQKSALARKGLHHANITGRFVSPDGLPVADVTVQIAAGRPRDLPLASAKSDSDGRFRFSDVNSEYAPGLAWYPPEEWRGAGPRLARFRWYRCLPASE
jgi:hypothetical protein